MGIEDSPLRDRAIFVEGMPRSGTTALVSMLAVHPRVAGVIAEARLFSRGVDTLYDNHGRRGRYDTFLSGFCSDEQLTDLVRELCDGVLVAMRDRVKPDADWVVEKSPAPLQDPARTLRYKLRTYPDAWYLHVLRDREQTVRSLAKAPWNPVDESGSRAWWEQSLAAVRELLADHPRFVEIDHAELVADPVATLERLFERLGLDSGDDLRGAVEAVSRERLSTFTPEQVLRSRPPAGRARRLRARAGRLAARARQLGGRRDGALRATCQGLIDAVRSGDAEAVARHTDDRLLLELRSGSGDLRAEGERARAELLALRETLLTPELISESWTAVDRSPASIRLLSAIRSDGDRLDASLAMLVVDGVVARVGIIAAGSPSGRRSSEQESSSVGTS